MNLLTPTQRRLLAQLGHLDPQRSNRPKSHALGAHEVAVVLVTAMLSDMGGVCRTADTIGRYAGQSRRVVSGHIDALVACGWLELTGTFCSQDPDRQCRAGTKHYQDTI